MPDPEDGTYSAGNEEAWWCFKHGNGKSNMPRQEINPTALWRVKCITQMNNQFSNVWTRVWTGRVILKKKLNEGSE